MSNYYSYHCLDCRASHKPANLNHGVEQLCAVLRHQAAFAALKPVTEETAIFDFYVNVSSGHTVPVGFLAEHLGHRVVACSEYHDHYYEPNETHVEEAVPREWEEKDE